MRAHDSLCDVLHRQVAAMEQLEGRLRAIELIVAAGHDRFLGLAVDDYNAAAERLAALEIARNVALVDAQLPLDATADDIIAALDDRDGRVATAVDAVRNAAETVADAQQRARGVVTDAASRSRARSEASRVLVAANLGEISY